MTTSENSAPNLPHFLDAHAVVRPNKVALICGERSLTYAEFNARARRVAIENGRRAVLRAVLAAAVGETVPSVPLRRAWVAAGAPPLDEAQLTAEVRRLGGEPDVDEGGQVVYRFPDLARETRALAAARRAAPAAERSPGEVIFSSLDGDES